jgi:hypothetical protein
LLNWGIDSLKGYTELAPTRSKSAALLVKLGDFDSLKANLNVKTERDKILSEATYSLLCKLNKSERELLLKPKIRVTLGGSANVCEPFPEKAEAIALENLSSPAPPAWIEGRSSSRRSKPAVRRMFAVRKRLGLILCEMLQAYSVSPRASGCS